MSALAKPVEERVPDVTHALEYLSASRLSCWQQCRRKHYFRYIARIPSQSTPALHLGKVVHAVLQRFNHWRWSNEKHQYEELRLVLDEAWDRELQKNPVDWEDDEVALDIRDKAWALIDAYVSSSLINEDDSIAGIEVRLDAELEELPPLMGILDLVHGDRRIVDYKTAAKSPSDGCAKLVHSTQLGVYAILYRHCTGEKECGLELHHLVKTKVPKVHVTRMDPVSDEEIANTIELMHRHVEAVKSGDYTCSPSFMCAGCEYLAECKAWKGAAA
ncbi:putative RecB family exonuclease [Rubritalea squalenifaciens DSM 18772]|uniref:Putative RecB family exonuclease n=1 Tax=Rubritalea squalenifaciens DSM 18772 TaxID=1123071 RepID=A0A1M6GGK6_9BACT|nr:PD-(D/E)XK nuclease family protein [Rubritalea squalenifaciens]SHJ08993.1 putative RecB family exonuclease [Rubritalea squalenifaciens DSM 18772]